jgi:hypothetical protein
MQRQTFTEDAWRFITHLPGQNTAREADLADLRGCNGRTAQ